MYTKDRAFTYPGLGYHSFTLWYSACFFPKTQIIEFPQLYIIRKCPRPINFIQLCNRNVELDKNIICVVTIKLVKILFGYMIIKQLNCSNAIG